MRNLRGYLTTGLAVALVFSLGAPMGLAEHGGSTSDELEVVGTFAVPQDGLTTDVWAFGNHAYIGSFDVIDGTDQCSLDLTGVRVIDISDPSDPSLESFIPAKPGTRNNDVKVEHIETPQFNGEILVASNEPCDAPFQPRTVSNGKAVLAGRGGISIWDVSNPAKPKALKQSFLTNGVHNTFIWQDGSNAYLIAVDDVAARDVIVVDITKPQSPKVIAEVGAPDWPDLDFSEIEGPSVFLHDVWVQDGIAYLSYWDAGLVLLDVSDPANPVFTGDSTYPHPDVVSGLPPEGNGHVAAPTADGSLVALGDEDFTKFTSFLNTSEGTFKIGVALFGPDPLETFPAGDIVWTGGEGCTTSEIPPADETDPDPQIALIQRGTCFFSEKAFNAQQQGYDAYIVANNEAGGEGLINMSAGTDDPVEIPGVFVGFSAGEALKAPGATVNSLDSTFDGEGFMRVLDVTDAGDIVQLGHFATEGVFSLGEIPEDRTAHNVIVRDRTAYWSWYWEGMRVVDFSDCEPGDGFESCTPTEVAHFVDTADHSNFWGVFVHDHPDGNTYILGSDRDSGLWIFADPLGE